VCKRLKPERLNWPESRPDERQRLMKSGFGRTHKAVVRLAAGFALQTLIAHGWAKRSVPWFGGKKRCVEAAAEKDFFSAASGKTPVGQSQGVL
jgi:hypothetical protein